ncbi:hypothetical protein [Flavobacterium cupreum]|uniref:hypothetical protein n=1 Tax=Flavobacterium cupreum TaxID=2133766 RepID=UPI000FCA39BB|nr:hypothetical protein [Flavobacterium cupreum]
MKKTPLSTILFSCVVLFIHNIALSQNLPPPGLPDEPVVIPINSMIYVLLAIGIVFGIYIIATRINRQNA